MKKKNLLCRLGIHFYGPKIDVDLRTINNKYAKNVAKFKRCKKCCLPKIGHTFIVRGEYHYLEIDEKLLKEHYKGWY